MGIKRTGILYRFQKSQHTLVSKCSHKKLEAIEVNTDSDFLSNVRKKLITFFRCFIHKIFFQIWNLHGNSVLMICDMTYFTDNKNSSLPLHFQAVVRPK